VVLSNHPTYLCRFFCYKLDPNNSDDIIKSIAPYRITLYNDTTIYFKTLSQIRPSGLRGMPVDMVLVAEGVNPSKKLMDELKIQMLMRNGIIGRFQE